MIKLVTSYKDDKANMQVNGNTEEILTDFAMSFSIIVNEWLKSCDRLAKDEETANMLKYDTKKLMIDFIENPIENYDFVVIDI